MRGILFLRLIDVGFCYFVIAGFGNGAKESVVESVGKAWGWGYPAVGRSAKK